MSWPAPPVTPGQGVRGGVPFGVTSIWTKGDLRFKLQCVDDVCFLKEFQIIICINFTFKTVTSSRSIRIILKAIQQNKYYF